MNMDNEITTLQSLSQQHKYEEAKDIASIFKEKCGADCPPNFLAEKGFMEAQYLMRTGLLDSAIQSIIPWLSQLDPNNPAEKDKYLAFTNLKGQCLRRIGKLEEASDAFLEILDLNLQQEEPDSSVLITCRVNLSTIDLYQQKFHKARVQLTEALELATRVNGPKSMTVAYCLNNLSLIANALGDLDKAVTYLEESIAIKEKVLGNSNASLAMTFLNLGTMLGEHNQYKRAVPYIRRAVDILPASSGKTHSNTVIAEITLGSIYADLGQKDSALIFLKSAEASIEDVEATNPFRAIHVLQHLAEGYKKLGDLATTRVYLDRAMDKMGAVPGKTRDFSKVIDLRYLNYNLQRRQEIYKGKLAEGAEIYADSVEIILEQHLALYRYLQQQGGESRDRQIITELLLPVFEGYLDFLAGQDQPPMEKVFELMEMGKARLLSEKLQQAEVPHFAGIPDSISNREAQLDHSINNLKQQVNGMRQNRIVEGLAEFEHELNQLQQEKRELLNYLEENHPSYHRLKYVQTPISLEQAQSNLEEDEALVSYYAGNHNIYILVLRKDSAKFTQIKRDFPLREWVSNLRESMYQHEDMASTSKNVVIQHSETYCQAAFSLYDKLLAPVADGLPLKVRIIPDGVLSFLPFDALLSHLPDRKEDFRGHPYLIHQFQFSYSISATLYHQQLQTPGLPAPKPALAMAPSFSSSSKFQNLLHSSEEVENIQTVMGGETLQGQKATAQAFREKAADFRILHIASHAKSDDQNGDNSYIAFATTDSSSQNQDLIHSRDIYGIPLQAEMVVLSACETGLGEWQAGEGIIGLTRACMYAGAKSTVTSLWQVDDSRTSILIQKFYNGLRDGLSKDAALRQAKLHYLNTEPSAHPYYWAAFIPIGNMAPITLEADYQGVWTGLSILFILLILSLFWRKTKKRKKTRL